MAIDRLSLQTSRLRRTRFHPGAQAQPGEAGRIDGAISRIPRGTIEPEQLRVILHRIATKFYDRAEVRDHIAARVVLDFP